MLRGPRTTIHFSLPQLSLLLVAAIEMGTSPSKPFVELTKEEVSSAVANLGDRYEGYREALVGNGVDGSLLATLDGVELLETLDDLHIANRLHRRVLLMELNKAKVPKEGAADLMATPYGYSPSTPASDLEAFRRVTDKCLSEHTETAILAGVHLILGNGAVLSLDTKIINDGKFETDTSHAFCKLAISSKLVNDGSNQHYYKIKLPLEVSSMFSRDALSMTYTGHVLKNESGERLGMVCMIDQCHPMDIEDNERAAFLWQAARETEFQLLLRKQLLARKANLQAVIEGYLDDIVHPAQSPSRHVGMKESNGLPFRNPSPVLVKQTIPILPSSFTGISDNPLLSTKFIEPAVAQRPQMARNNTERLAALGLLRLDEISPEEEIAVHLRRMVKMATQLFSFKHGEITFRHEEEQYRIAGYGESEEISYGFKKIFQPVTTNPDGTCFLGKMVAAQALCNYTVTWGKTFVVHDLAANETFKSFASVLPIRSYVGTPIKDSSGSIIAVLCLFDNKPRPDVDAAQEMQMEHIGRLISQSLENWALSRVAEVLQNESKMISRGSEKTGPPKGDVTFVVTDIEGSTAMWESTPTAMQIAQDIHDDILRKVCAAYGGCEVETEGDSFILAFHDPVDALSFTLKTQEALYEAEWPEAILNQPQARVEANSFRGVRVRMGVHHGFAGFCDEFGRVDYKGETLNFAKNFSTLSHGGQIVVTSETWTKASHYTGSALAYPQVLDLGAHVVKKGKTTRDGLVTKGVIQLVPSSFAYDYINARKLPSAPEEERHEITVDGKLPGRQFPPILSMKQVSASFHDAPYKNNEVTVAFVDMSAIDEKCVAALVHLMGSLLSSMLPLGGYQCQKELFVFNNLLDAVIFGLRVQSKLSERGSQDKGGRSLGTLIKYVCTHGTFQTMGPNRTTGRAEYFGKVVNRAARLSSLTPPGSVCFGVFRSHGEEGGTNMKISPVQHPAVVCRFREKRNLIDIQEELVLFECTPKGDLDVTR